MHDHPDAPPSPEPAARESAIERAGRLLGARVGPARTVRVEPAPLMAVAADEALLDAFRRGDAGAFAALFDRHARSTWRAVRHLLGPADEAAADVVLEASWVEVARQAAQLDAQPRWMPWLFALVRGRVHAYLDATGAAGAEDAPGAAPADDAMAEPPAPDDLMPAGADPMARARTFLGALARLPATVREAVVLQLEAGLDLTDIAAIADAPVDAIRARVHDGVAHLAEVAGSPGPGDGSDPDVAAVARAYAQAWAMRDASSRGPDARVRERVLAIARAAVAPPADAGAAHAPPADAPVLDDIAEGPLDFAAEVDAALDSVLRDGTSHEAAPSPAAGGPTGDAAAALPPAPQEPRLAADTGAGAPPAAPMVRPPPWPSTRPAPALAQRVATLVAVALMAGGAGWEVRDRLGHDLVGAVFTTPAQPATATAAASAAALSRSHVDEAIAQADAALDRASAVAAGTAAPASRPAIEAAASTPAAASAAVPAPSTAVALAAAPLPALATTPQPAPPAPAPALAASAATPTRPAITAAASASAAAPTPAVPHAPDATPSAPSTRHAKARHDAPAAALAVDARADTRAARPRQSTADAIKAAQARADAFLAGDGASAAGR